VAHKDKDQVRDLHKHIAKQERSGCSTKPIRAVREGLFTLPTVSFGADESHRWSLGRIGAERPTVPAKHGQGILLKKGVEAPDLPP